VEIILGTNTLAALLNLVDQYYYYYFYRCVAIVATVGLASIGIILMLPSAAPVRAHAHGRILCAAEWHWGMHTRHIHIASFKSPIEAVDIANFATNRPWQPGVCVDVHIRIIERVFRLQEWCRVNVSGAELQSALHGAAQ